MAQAQGPIRRSLSLFWRWFLYWRKRYFWLRLCVLLIILALTTHDVVNPTIRRLVVIAIQGIEDASWPKAEFAHARYLRFAEAKRLQNSLVGYFDANNDRRLNAREGRQLTRTTGLDPEDVTGTALNADLAQLIEANRKVGLVSDSYSATEVRRRAADAARGDAAIRYQEYRPEVDSLLASSYRKPADYLRWETWREGLQRFAEMNPVRQADWRILLAVFLLATVISVRGYARSQALARRFEEDPDSAKAPCPACGEPTHDFGALPQHRFSRAAATAVVVFLAGYTAAALAQSLGATSWLADVRSPGPSLVAGMPALAGVALGVLRWVLWPREVHACHRFPPFRVLGFAAGVVLVVALLCGLVLFGLKALEYRPTRFVRSHPVPAEVRRPQAPGRSARTPRLPAGRGLRLSPDTPRSGLRSAPGGLSGRPQRRGPRRGRAGRSGRAAPTAPAPSPPGAQAPPGPTAAESPAPMQPAAASPPSPD